MELGFTSLTVGQDDHDQYSPENSQDSPSSGVFNDNKTISSSSHKRSRRSLRKRVVSVPVKEIQGSRLKISDADMGMIFSIREEEESLFADLGELPECAMVFGRREMMKEEENNRRGCSLAPW
ncbi:hypothetical protein L1987_63207 [Smallanthus sonchifolius]|uniref:Uncharacterized protein n=1 Tax=Smallanthus sonchifolius TaxID=185202 RepID=A0ACB9CCM1_9ASTR|nr:hypothetical protein L1987_63207 [Smallanthus sonchifolius]